MLIRTEATSAIIDFLKQDEILNLNMLGIIKSTPEVELFTDDARVPTGVLIRQNEYFHFLYTKNPTFIDAVCDFLKPDEYYGFSGVEEGIAQEIRSRFKVDWCNPCTLYYLPKDALDLSLQKTAAQSLDPKYAPLVDQHYQYSSNHSLAAITDNLTNRPSSAVFVDGEPVCWVMLHEDESMGIMYTLEEHRRKGYAVDVTIDLCRQLIEAEQIPYLQIVETNDQSPGLAAKCGFVPYGKVTWFGIIVGNPPSGEA